MKPITKHSVCIASGISSHMHYNFEHSNSNEDKLAALKKQYLRLDDVRSTIEGFSKDVSKELVNDWELKQPLNKELLDKVLTILIRNEKKWFPVFTDKDTDNNNYVNEEKQ